MRDKSIFFILTYIVFLLGCDPIKLSTTQSVLEHLNSPNKDSILIGAYNAQITKDSVFIPLLLKNVSDPRISHHKNFYGITVYYGCIIALKKITKKEPPHKITHEVDTVNVNFYRSLYK
jgi:hypothetical protein